MSFKNTIFLFSLFFLLMACATEVQKKPKPRAHLAKKTRAQKKKIRPVSAKIEACPENKLIHSRPIKRPESSEDLVTTEQLHSYELFTLKGKKFKDLVSSYETRMPSYEFQELHPTACVSWFEGNDNWETHYPLLFDHKAGEEFILSSGGDYRVFKDGHSFVVWNCLGREEQKEVGRCLEDAEIEFFFSHKGKRVSSGSYLLSYLLERMGPHIQEFYESIPGVVRVYLEPKSDWKYNMILKSNEIDEIDCEGICKTSEYQIGEIHFTQKKGQVSLRSIKGQVKNF